jgi:hypothetical protein
MTDITKMKKLSELSKFLDEHGWEENGQWTCGDEKELTVLVTKEITDSFPLFQDDITECLKKNPDATTKDYLESELESLNENSVNNGVGHYNWSIESSEMTLDEEQKEVLQKEQQ